MWERIVEAGTGVYILWGIGILGLVLHMLLGLYLNSMVKASKDMSTTRKKSISVIRRKIENRRALCMDMGSKEAFVDKNVYSIRWLGFPIRMWGRLGHILCYTVVMAAAGAFLYYDVGWRGSPDMIYFMSNAIFVCAFLMLIENIFLVTNKLELLKANIWDYIETCRAENKTRKDLDTGPVIMTEEVKPVEGSAEKENDNEAAASNEEILNSFLKEFFA